MTRNIADVLGQGERLDREWRGGGQGGLCAAAAPAALVASLPVQAQQPERGCRFKQHSWR